MRMNLINNPSVDVNTVSGLGTTRISTDYFTADDSNSHAVTIKSGGTLSDIWWTQRNTPNGFANDQEFYAAVLASNPGITDVNKIQAGQTIYLPQKHSDGAITYHYANGASIRSNAATGEYNMVIPDDSGKATYTRTRDAQGHFIDRYTQTNASGQTTTTLTTSDDWTTRETSNVTYLENAATGEKIVVYNTTDFLAGRQAGDVVQTTPQAEGGKAVATYNAQEGLWLTEKINQQGQVTERFTSSDNPLDASDPGHDGVGLWGGGLEDFTTADFDSINAFTGLPEYTRTTRYLDVDGNGHFDRLNTSYAAGSILDTLVDTAAPTPTDILAIQRLNANLAGMETAGLAAAEIRGALGLDAPAEEGASHGLYDFNWLGTLSLGAGRDYLSLGREGAQGYAGGFGRDGADLGGNSPYSLVGGSLDDMPFSLGAEPYYDSLFTNASLDADFGFNPDYSFDGLDYTLAGGSGDTWNGGFDDLGSWTPDYSLWSGSGSLGDYDSGWSIDPGYSDDYGSDHDDFDGYGADWSTGYGNYGFSNIGYPVVLDLDGDGVELVGLAASHAWYDMTGDGYRRHTGWIGGDDAFLAADLDGDGQITRADELSFARRTTAADTDLKALDTLYDSNHDGVVDANDTDFGQLRVWQDKNGDGVSDAGEVSTLAQVGIGSVSLNRAPVDYASGGNQVSGFANYHKTDGGAGYAADVALGYERQGYLVQDRNDGLVRVAQAGGLTFGLIKAAFTTDAAVAGVDGLIGGEGADNFNTSGTQGVMLDGGAGNDQLTGGAGDDWLAGGAGSDILKAGAGNDVLLIDASDSQADLDGGDGFDIALVQGDAGVFLNLTTARLEAVVGGGGNDTFSMTGGTGSIQFGKGGNDTLIGSKGTDYLDGGSGNDILQGSGGNDVYVFNRGDGQDEVSDSYTAQVTVVWYEKVAVYGWKYSVQVYYDSLWGWRTKTVGGYGVVGYDDVKRNRVESQSVDAGADTLRLGANIALEDVSIASNGSDKVLTLSREGVVTSDTVTFKNWSNVLNRIETIDFDNGESYAIVDMLFGTSQSDILTGTAAANVLHGGAGADTLRGEAGDDVYVVDNASDVVEEDADAGRDLVRASVSHVLATNVEDLTLTGNAAINGIGNSLDNLMLGNAAANTLDGGAGADILRGEAGDDVYMVDNASDVVEEDADAGRDLVRASVSHVLATNVEDLTLTGNAAINGIGNSLDNLMLGNAAANTLDGGAGTDTLRGEAGDDVYVVDNASDVVEEEADAGRDLVRASVSHALTANVEDLTLTGNAAINGIGNSLDNVMLGNAAANTLDGGTGADTLIGGGGDDTYVFNRGDGVDEIHDEMAIWTSTPTYGPGMRGITVVERTQVDAGLDTLRFGANISLQDLDFTQSGTDIVIGLRQNGIATPDLITLKNQSNNLSRIEFLEFASGERSTLTVGTTDEDNLVGESENNVLLGGQGNDLLQGSGGDDTYIFNRGSGIDEIHDEHSVMQPYTYKRRASGFSRSRSVTVTEYRSVQVDAGTDTLHLGNDIRLEDLRLVMNGADLVIDLLQNGQATSDCVTLRNQSNYLSRIETIEFADSKHFDLTRAVIGTTGNDITYGSSDAVTLIGGAGNDSLSGGSGNDTYLFNRGDGQDTVYDNDTTANNQDIARFSASIDFDQLWFRKSGNNLEASIIGTTDKVTIQNWYSGSAYHIERFEAGDKALLDSQVDALVQAMAAFSPPAAGQTSLPDAYRQALAPVLAANWQ